MPSLPQLRRHATLDLAYVYIDGRQTYLGRWDSEESHDRYERLIREYRANGYRLPDTRPKSDTPTVAELVAAYYPWARDEYRYSDAHLARIRIAARPLVKLYAATHTGEFSAPHLRAVRDVWLEQGLSRKYVNHLTAAVKAIFRWGAEYQYVPLDRFREIELVSLLRKGRSRAVETVERQPVDWQPVRCALRHMTRVQQSLVLLAWWTGARPGELVLLEPRFVDTTGPVWFYDPPKHKTAHLEKTRRIYIGPRAQRILRPWLDRPHNVPCFSPRESLKQSTRRNAAGARRKNQRPNPRKTARRVNPRYSVDTFRQFVKRACSDAGLPEHLWWTPHQLRHAAGTRFRSSDGIDIEMALLGHETVAASEVYGRIKEDRAIEAALRLS